MIVVSLFGASRLVLHRASVAAVVVAGLSQSSTVSILAQQAWGCDQPEESNRSSRTSYVSATFLNTYVASQIDVDAQMFHFRYVRTHVRVFEKPCRR